MIDFDEAKRRASHAIKALRGKSQHVDEVDWPPAFHHDHQIVFDIEDPGRGLDRIENPDAALLGRISKSEQQYLAAAWLYDRYQGEDIADRGDYEFVGGLPTGEHLRRIKYDLRDDAEGAILTRLEVERNDERVVIKDPSTGIKRRAALHPFAASDESTAPVTNMLNRSPQFVLETLEKQIIHD